MKMNRIAVIGVALAGTMAMAMAQGEAKDELAGAVKKLGEAANYSWKTTSSFGGSDRTSTSEGKANHEGLIYSAATFGDTKVEMFKKGEAGAVRGEDGWRSLAEIQAERDAGGDDGQRRRRGFSGLMLERLTAPAAQVAELAGKLSGVESQEGVLVGTLTEEAVKEMSTFRRRGGGEAPAISDASGTVKFWLAEGVLVKFETTTKATRTFNEQPRTFERTSVTEISGVGETEIEVPEEVKAKLGS